MNALNEALIAAHDAGDTESLIRLYTQAGNHEEDAGNVNAACFYLTHAYVFALEAGNSHAADLHARLKAHGREA